MADTADSWTEWEQWVRRALGGSERQVAAATNAALGAIAAGGTQKQAVDAARAAWGHEGLSTRVPSEKPAAEAPAASPPHEPVDPSALVGVVRNLSKGVGPYRGRPAALQIWTFRVETDDERGNPGELFGVEMRGHEITGTLDNGDWVEIGERPKSGQGYRPKKLRNLTTNDTVRARMRWLLAE